MHYFEGSRSFDKKEILVSCEVRQRLPIVMRFFPYLACFALVSCFKLFSRQPRHLSTGQFTIMCNDAPIPDKTPIKSTKFDRIVDDFLNKRYGAGEAFYGKSTSKLSEEEYSKSQPTKQVYDKDAPMKSNSILIVGGIEDIGQWVAFEMSDKGFYIRVLSQSLKDMTSVFGFPSVNADMVELNGIESDEKDFARAIEGVQAIVLCCNFNPRRESAWTTEKMNEEVKTAIGILDIAIKARNAGVGTIKKITLVSRAVPKALLQSSENGGGWSPVAALTAPTSNLPCYDEFRSRHEYVERAVRNSGFEYTIVRAPPFVEISRPPAEFPLTLLSASTAQTCPPILPAVRGNLFTNWLEDTANAVSIGVLDLAEVVTQSLIQDVTGVTFTAYETLSAVQPAPSAATGSAGDTVVIAGQRELERSRISRKVRFYLTMIQR